MIRFTFLAFALLLLGVACSKDNESEATPVPAAAAAATSPQSQWAQDRVAAVNRIWHFSDAGVDWMQNYDFRQMVGQPTWYGSTGFRGYAGAGQAVPKTIVHEFSHSYWGAFEVAGRPDLNWDKDGGPSEGHLAFRADLRRFMAQPPDRFEPLRDRFRNLTNLTLEDDSDLYHFGEAELIYMTGGDIDLVPPILRAYYASFLTDLAVGGLDFDAWSEALTWFQSLPDEDRRIAGEVFGIQHFPLEQYKSLKGDEASLPQPIADTLAGEDRQRLRDFAEQFDEVRQRQFSFVDAAGIDRGFQSWRSYIRGMNKLHNEHPAVLLDAGGRGPDLAMAFDFYASVNDMSAEEQAARVRERFDQPTIPDLAVLLEPQVLVELFKEGTEGTVNPVTTALAGYADTLRELVIIAEAFVEAAETNPALAAKVFDDFVAARDSDLLRSTAPDLIDLLRDLDREALRRGMPLISDVTVLRLLSIRAEIVRSDEVTPGRLLEAIGATLDADATSLAEAGILLFTNSSGNFAIDRAADRAFYDLLATLETGRPGLSLIVMRDASLGLRQWINARPAQAAIAIHNDVSLAAQLVMTRESVRSSAPRTLHRIIAEDPRLAAELIVEIEDSRGTRIAPQTLEFMVFNGYWAELEAGPAIDLGSDGRFLYELARLKGEEWLVTAFDEAVQLYETEVDAGHLEPDYRPQHAATLDAIAENAVSSEIAAIAGRLRDRLN